MLFTAGQIIVSILMAAQLSQACTKIISFSLLCINLPSAFLSRAQNRSAASADVFVLIVLLPRDEMIRDSDTVWSEKVADYNGHETMLWHVRRD